MYRFINKHRVKIIVVATICFAVFLTFLLIVPELKAIDNQVATLYRQAELVEEDFSSIWGMSNVNVSIDESKVKIVFQEKYCKLELSYDKNGQLISKEFEDIRLCSTPGGLICGILMVLIASFLLSFCLTQTVIDMGERSTKKQKNKRANKHKEENNNTVI